MRKPDYLSPTSMSKWNEDPNLYYLKYLSNSTQPEERQTAPMAVGSAFDAFIKSHLYEMLFGSPSAAGNDARFTKDAIFEEQVEPHNRDESRIAGEHCFSAYRLLGALDALMIDLGRAKGPPKFEMDVRGGVSYGREDVIHSVPFRVKPDLHYINEHGAFVIFDWKVNGYYSRHGKSPTPGFVRARRYGKMPWTHDDCDLGTFKGIIINTRKGLEAYDSEWARQCAVGAWVCGAKVLDDFVCVIHQLACAPNGLKPKITVAEHAGHVTLAYQEQIHEEATQMWDAITRVVHDCGRAHAACEGQGCIECAMWVGEKNHWVLNDCACQPHVFRKLSLQDSRALCDLLDQRKEIVADTLNPALDW